MASAETGHPPMEELQQIALSHFWPHSQQVSDLEKSDGLHVVTEGEGCWVTDTEGRRFIDVLAGMFLVNVGYGRREIADAVREQLQRVHYAPESTTSVPTLKLVAKLASLAPDKNSRVFLTSGGSEAVESALKIAKAYHRQKGNSGRYKIISRKGSYHGATLGTMSLGGSHRVISRWILEPDSGRSRRTGLVGRRRCPGVALRRGVTMSVSDWGGRVSEHRRAGAGRAVADGTSRGRVAQVGERMASRASSRRIMKCRFASGR